MRRYKIEDVKINLDPGYGMIPGAIAVSVRYDDGTESKWLHETECDGCAGFHLSEEDINDRLVYTGDDDRKLKRMSKLLDSTSISEFDGFRLGDYDVLMRSMEKGPEHPALPLIRYIVSLVRCPLEDTDKLIEAGIGRYADEIESPIIDEVMGELLGQRSGRCLGRDIQMLQLRHEWRFNGLFTACPVCGSALIERIG